MKQASTTQPTTPRVPQPGGNATIDTATLELLERWRSEDATADPEQLRTAERELAEFKKAMNENRTAAGEPAVYP